MATTSLQNQMLTGTTQSQQNMMPLLAPDLIGQQQKIARQQQIIQSLRDQGSAPDEPTQVIGGWAIRQSPFSALAKVGAALGSAYLQKQTDDKQAELSKALAERQRAGLMSAFGLNQPSAPAPDISSLPQTTNDQNQPIAPYREGYNPIAQALASRSQPSDPFQESKQKAFDLYMNGMTDPAEKILSNVYSLTDQQKNMNAMGQDPKQMGILDTAEKQARSMFTAPAGTTTYNMATGQQKYQPTIGAGMNLTTGANGQPLVTPIEGFSAANANIQGAQAGATEAAKAGLDIVQVPDGKGGSISMPRSQAAALLGGKPTQSAEQVTPNTPMTFNFRMPAGGGVHLENANFHDVIGNINNAKELNPVQKQQAIQMAMEQYTTQAAGGKVTPPQAPAGLGQGQSKFASTMAEHNALNAADYEKALNSRIDEGASLNKRIQDQIQTLKQFQAGGGTETRVKLATMAQGLGMPQSLVDQISKGSLSAAQEFKKQATLSAMASLKQALSGNGRMTQQEFQVYLDANPNLSTDPNAITHMMDFANKMYRQDMSEQQAYQTYKKLNPDDYSGFPSYWSQQQQALGYTDPSANVAGAKGASPAGTGRKLDTLPNPATSKGMVIRAPDGTLLKSTGSAWVRSK